jgi:hypothetical protein
MSDSRLHVNISLLVNRFLSGRLLLHPVSTLRIARRSESFWRMMPAALFLVVTAGAEAAALLGLGWLFFHCYPSVIPWLNDVSDLQWPDRTWGALLGLLVFSAAVLRRLQGPTPLHQGVLFWAAAVAGPSALVSWGSILLPSGDLWNAGLTDAGSVLAFAALFVFVVFSPQILAVVVSLMVCATTAILCWSLVPFRNWWRYLRHLVERKNVPPLQQLALILGGWGGGVICALMIGIILISVLQRSSPFMFRLLDYGWRVVGIGLVVGVVALIGIGLLKDVFDRFRGVDGWIYLGTGRDRFMPNFVAISIARGAAMAVTGIWNFFVTELLAIFLGLFILVLAIVLLQFFWDAGVSSVWDAAASQILAHRAMYSGLLIAAILGGVLAILGVVASRRMRQ